MIHLLLTAVLVVIQSSGGLAACPKQCPPSVQIKSKAKGKVVFAIIGDFGRVGGVKSTMNVSSGGFDNDGRCVTRFASSAPQDAVGGPIQRMLAKALDRACGATEGGCSFIANTGDNFYECGAESMARFQSDWKAIYQTKATPNIADLPWINSIGNHDIVQDVSVPNHIAFAKMDRNFIFPERNYTYDIVSADESIRMRFVVINTNPMVTSYQTSKKYNFPELQATSTPEKLIAQLRFMDASLKSSTATYDFVIGHHPIFGTASTLYGHNVSFAGSVPGSAATDLGMPNADGKPSFAQVLHVIRKYKAAAYFNGHDHTLAYAHDAIDPVLNPTAYITSGAGSFPDLADSCGFERPNVLFTSTTGPKPGAVCGGDVAGMPHAGFVIATATQRLITYDHYRLNSPNATSYTLAFTSASRNWRAGRKPMAGCSC